MWHKGIFFIVAAVVVSGFVRILAPSTGISDLAHESVRLQLNLVGSGIYEYQAAQGKWPTRNDDLAKTSLPATSPYWKYELDEELIVIVWDRTLKPDPKENDKRILAYYNKGLISEQGRSWVCWGDLRTEYIKTDDLRAYLQKLKD